MRARALFLRAAQRLQFIPATLARLCVGWVFVQSGWGKLHNLDKVTAYFTELHLPAPQLQAPFVASSELVFGLLVLIGLLTRLAAIPLACIMLVAIVTAKMSDIHGLDDLFGTIELVYLIVLLYLVTNGPGPTAIDHVIAKKIDQS